MKKEKNDNKNYFDWVCYHCSKKGQMSNDCHMRKSNETRSEKAEKAVDGDDDELVFSLFTSKNKKKKKKKVWFVEDVKMPVEVEILFNINGDTLYSFTKNTWIGNSGASCLITNNNTHLYDVIKICK